jgi:hypothetical protein
MHERLRDAVVSRSSEQYRDPKVDLALAGWTSLQADGLTDRVNVDAPDNFEDTTIIKRFARSHDAGSIVVARHPSGDVSRWTDPATVDLSDRLR